MKVRRTISIDSETDKEIEKILDEEISKLSAKSYRELRRMNRKINYSTIVDKLLKKAIKYKKDGLFTLS